MSPYASANAVTLTTPPWPVQRSAVGDQAFIERPVKVEHVDNAEAWPRHVIVLGWVLHGVSDVKLVLAVDLDNLVVEWGVARRQAGVGKVPNDTGRCSKAGIVCFDRASSEIRRV